MSAEKKYSKDMGIDRNSKKTEYSFRIPEKLPFRRPCDS